MALQDYDLGDGRVLFEENLLAPENSSEVFQELMEHTSWRQEEITLFGRRVKQPRLTAWYGLGMSAASRYTEATDAQPWSETLLELKAVAEARAGVTFNSVLCNLYRDGNDSMGFHADDEACLGPEPVIASFSLGAPRRFVLKHRTQKGRKREFLLTDGSLLIMTGSLQKHWNHGVPKTQQVHEPRINLTFRRLVTYCHGAS